MKRKILQVGLWLMVAVALATATFATDYVATTADEFYGYLEQALTLQESDFTIQYGGDDLTSEEGTLAVFQRELATWEPPSVDNPLNVAYNIFGGDSIQEGDLYSFSNVEYLSTPEELAFVEQAVLEIAAELDLEDASDLLKIRTVYSYMTSNFTYDFDLERFSAYDGLVEGTMVCQGYALLTNRMMWAVGIPSTVVTGASRSQNHAWNAVEYDGLWYMLDTTWDSADNAGTEGTWNYFMESGYDFSGHTNHGAYETDRFLESHPMAEEALPTQMISIMDGESTIGSLIIRVGISTSFDAGMPEGLEDATPVWSSGNQEFLDVTEDGTVTGVAPGATWLQVTAPEEETVFPKRITVNVVDMSTLSPWAEEDIVDFYLATMLPASLCSDYQSTLDRGELARLTSNYVVNTVGLGTFQIKNLYEDMDGHTDVFNALRCNALELMMGVSDTEFDPDTAVTRQMVVTVVMRLMEHVNDTEYEADLSLLGGETQIADWAEEAMAKAVALGIFQGDEDGLRPLDTMTREEVYLVYARAFQTYVPEVEEEESL